MQLIKHSMQNWRSITQVINSISTWQTTSVISSVVQRHSTISLHTMQTATSLNRIPAPTITMQTARVGVLPMFNTPLLPPVSLRPCTAISVVRTESTLADDASSADVKPTIVTAAHIRRARRQTAVRKPAISQSELVDGDELAPQAVTTSLPTAETETMQAAAVKEQQEGEKKAPILLIDGHGLAHRSFHALMNSFRGGFKTSNGTPTSITAGVMKSLQTIICDLKPAAVLVAFDKGRSFRKELAGRLKQLEPDLGEDLIIKLCQVVTALTESHKLLDKQTLTASMRDALPPQYQHLMDTPVAASPYKAGRQEIPDAFKQDMHNFQALLSALRIPQLSIPYVEADDTIAALAAAATQRGHPVRILSLDHDLLQLVNNASDVSVMLMSAATTKAGKACEVMKEEDVLKKHGVLPQKFADFRALTGDKSDNITGVKGIGPANATALINEYGSLEDIFSAIDKMKPAVGNKLKAGRKDAEISRLLTKLGSVQVDLGVTADELFSLQGFRTQEVLPLLQRLEMKDLTKHLTTLQEALGGEAATPLSPHQLALANCLWEGPPGFTPRPTVPDVPATEAVVDELDSALVRPLAPTGITDNAAVQMMEANATPASQDATSASQPPSTDVAVGQQSLIVEASQPNTDIEPSNPPEKPPAGKRTTRATRSPKSSSPPDGKAVCDPSPNEGDGVSSLAKLLGERKSRARPTPSTVTPTSISRTSKNMADKEADASKLNTSNTTTVPPQPLQRRTAPQASIQRQAVAVGEIDRSAVGCWRTSDPEFVALDLVQTVGSTGAKQLVEQIKQEIESMRQYCGFQHPLLGIHIEKQRPIHTAGGEGGTKGNGSGKRRKSRSKSSDTEAIEEGSSLESAEETLPNDPATSAVSKVGRILLCWQQPVGFEKAEQMALRVGAIDLNSVQDDTETLAAIKEVWALLVDPTICKVSHNFKPLHRLGIELGLGKGMPMPAGNSNPGKVEWVQGATSGICGPLIDTMLAAYLADPQQDVDSHSVIAMRWGCARAQHFQALLSGSPAGESGDVSSMSDWREAGVASVWAIAAHLEAHQEKARRDAAAGLTFDPTTKEAQKGLDAACRELLDKLEQPLQEVLAGMEITGIKIDTAVLKELDTLAKEELRKATEQAQQMAQQAGWQGTFEMQKTKDVGELLFDTLKLPCTRKTPKGQPSVSKEALEDLIDMHPIIRVILYFRKLGKTMEYLNAISQALKVSKDGRIHTTFKQNGAVTGRMSSSDPNVQNIPREGDESENITKRVRDVFVPETGWKIIAADYSQMELRMLAALSGEPKLCQGYREEKDVHAITARLLLGLPEDAPVDKEQRQIGKQSNFGIIYGMGSRKLASNTGSGDNKQAKQFIQKFRKEYPLVHDVMERNKILAVTQGYVVTAHGRRRYFDFSSPPLLALRGKDPNTVAALPRNSSPADAGQLREAGNMPIQGTAADLMKRVIVRAAAELLARGLHSRIILSVHDSLVLEVYPGEETIVADLVKRCMEGADDGMLSQVPLKADIKTSDTHLI